MATWYYVENNQQTGPLGEAEFLQLVSQGRIQAATLVWNETMPSWQPYAQVRAASVQRQAEALATGATPATLQDAPTPLRAGPGTDAAGTPVIYCAECRRSFAPAEVVPINGQWICATCKPIVLQKLREGVYALAAQHYAGFWIRVVAKFIDVAILFAVNLVVGILLDGILAALGPALGWDAPLRDIVVRFGVALLVQLAIGLVFTVFFLGRYAATPGKMACGLVVICPDGTVLTYARACGRYFANLLSVLTLCIGYVMAAFDPEKRALHDHLCDTRVVYR